jgi:hypothetical protein
MELLDLLINAFVTMFSLGLLLISVMSYRKYQSPKLVFIIVVFVLFLIKSLFFSYGLFNPEISQFVSTSYFRLFDFGILVMLFVGALKR